MKTAGFTAACELQSLFYSFLLVATDVVPTTPEPNFLSKFIHTVLETLFQLFQKMGVSSYVLALLAFTIIIKLVLYPLAVKQMRSTRNMQKIQPKLKAIQEKYKDNPQKLQEAQLKFYKEANFNPLSGCLPLLIQIPIIYILFTGIRSFAPSSPEYFTFFWVPDLSLPDPSGIWIPVLVALSTFLQQYISMTNKGDKTQKMMLMIMPVMMFFVCRSFPAGVAIYWIFYGLISGVQQAFVNAKGKREDAIQEAKDEEERLQKEQKKKSKKKAQANQMDKVFDEIMSDETPAEQPTQRKKWAPPGSPDAE